MPPAFPPQARERAKAPSGGGGNCPKNLYCWDPSPCKEKGGMRLRFPTPAHKPAYAFMDPLTTLTELLRELPGIGPRQARRLAHWFVRKNNAWLTRFTQTLLEAQKIVRTCAVCMRMFPAKQQEEKECPLCRNSDRDTSLLLIVEKDMDLENIERTGAYKGRYFVLGGTTSPLEKEPERMIHIRELSALLEATTHIKEVIFACSATTEGEDTMTFVSEKITPILAQKNIRLSVLGRGLSTGTELEYIDGDTLKNALQGRR